jgi:membrane-associated phospholipid phosphatase
MLYALAFLGYLFVPARGPVVFLAEQLEPLAGGFFYGQVLNAVEASGGPHGAMPSLHLGISLVVCGFDLKVNRLRGLIYIPLVLGILFATVLLRYHWVVDLLVGAILAGLALRYSKGLVHGAPSVGGRS